MSTTHADAASVQGIADALRACLESGNLSALAHLYAPDAVLDASVPGERILRRSQMIRAWGSRARTAYR